MIDILLSATYALVFLVPSLVILGAGYWVLDVITPGHKLGDRLTGRSVPQTVNRQGLTFPAETVSYSAGLVTSAWLLVQGAIIFTAIWTNAHGTDIWSALGWTVAFSIVGLALQVVGFFALDLATPGRLGDEICEPGPVLPVAMVSAALVVAIGLVVIASIA